MPNGRLNDLTGRKFEFVTVLRQDIERPRQTYRKNKALGHENPTSGHSYWVCECDCGKVFSARSDNLTSGRTRSCGCNQAIPAARRSPQRRRRKLYKQKKHVERAWAKIVAYESDEVQVIRDDRHKAYIRYWRDKRLFDQNQEWLARHYQLTADPSTPRSVIEEHLAKRPEPITRPCMVEYLTAMKAHLEYLSRLLKLTKAKVKSPPPAPAPAP